MKMSLTAIMKKVKELDEQKRALIAEENENRRFSYVSEKDKVNTGYDYRATREALDALDKETLRLKSILAKVNAKLVVCDYPYTISEALIRLAQLSAKRAQLEALPTVQSMRRVTFNGVIEYTDTLCDTAEVKKDISALREEISRLQMAIDKTNLIYETEV